MREFEPMSETKALSVLHEVLLIQFRRHRDHAQLEKMRQLGMKPEDEYKLSSMRDYINKLAAARQA
jgi:hypothetical protein